MKDTCFCQLRRATLEDKIIAAEASGPHGHNPLWKTLLSDDGPQFVVEPITIQPKATPLPVPDKPTSAGEASARHQAISLYLGEGYTYAEFCKLFGP